MFRICRFFLYTIVYFFSSTSLAHIISKDDKPTHTVLHHEHKVNKIGDQIDILQNSKHTNIKPVDQPVPALTPKRDTYMSQPFLINTWLFLFLFIVLLITLNSKQRKHILPLLTFLSMFISCLDNSTLHIVETNTISKTRTTFLDSVFTPFKKVVRYDNAYYYVESNGLPVHKMMVGITNWQQQVPVPHSFTGSNAWSVPLQPTFETTPKSLKTNFMKGAVAIAANGIPIFNPLNNRGEDAKIIGELDNWGGHCGKADDYHYHVAPLHLSSTAYPHFPIAIALDGFAIYGSTEPDGTSVQPLDENNGHIYKNSYHYHGINSYPYIMGSMRGKVATDPSTTAPENQITPQPSFSPVREAQSPLNGASIADFSALSTRSYKLTYQLSGNNGYVEYSWDETEKNFTYKLTSPSGAVTNNTYTRK